MYEAGCAHVVGGSVDAAPRQVWRRHLGRRVCSGAHHSDCMALGGSLPFLSLYSLSVNTAGYKGNPTCHFMSSCEAYGSKALHSAHIYEGWVCARP